MSAFQSSKLYSILHLTCPFCHKGAFFLSHPYDLKHAGDLHETCPACHRKYEMEPGFYYGAMFVSYALSIAFSLLAFGGEPVALSGEDVPLKNEQLGLELAVFDDLKRLLGHFVGLVKAAFAEQGARVTEQDRAIAQRNGYDPERVAASRAALFGNHGAPARGV